MINRARWWVFHNTLFWKSRTHSVNDSIIHDFDWVILEIPVKICIVGMLLTYPIVYYVITGNFRDNSLAQYSSACTASHILLYIALSEMCRSLKLKLPAVSSSTLEEEIICGRKLKLFNTWKKFNIKTLTSGQKF